MLSLILRNISYYRCYVWDKESKFLADKIDKFTSKKKKKKKKKKTINGKKKKKKKKKNKKLKI